MMDHHFWIIRDDILISVVNAAYKGRYIYPFSLRDKEQTGIVTLQQLKRLK